MKQKAQQFEIKWDRPEDFRLEIQESIEQRKRETAQIETDKTASAEKQINLLPR